MNNIVTKVILIIAIIGAVIGVGQINDDLSKRTSACSHMFSADLKSGERCTRDALDTHNEAVNRGWGITIVSAIVVLGTSVILYGEQDNNRDNKASKQNKLSK